MPAAGGRRARAPAPRRAQRCAGCGASQRRLHAPGKDAGGCAAAEGCGSRSRGCGVVPRSVRCAATSCPSRLGRSVKHDCSCSCVCVWRCVPRIAAHAIAGAPQGAVVSGCSVPLSTLSTVLGRCTQGGQNTKGCMMYTPFAVQLKMMPTAWGRCKRSLKRCGKSRRTYKTSLPACQWQTG